MKKPTESFKNAVRALLTMPDFTEGQRIAIVAQWMHESVNGNSLLGREHTNFAGLKWRNELIPFGQPRQIKVPSEMIPVSFAWFPESASFAAGYRAFIKRSVYEDWERHEFRGFIDHLWRRGYAVDPDYVSKVERYFDDAEDLIGELSVESKKPSQPKEPSWFEFHRFGMDAPYVVAYAGSEPLFRIQTRSKERLINFLALYPNAKNFEVANGAKPVPDVPTLSEDDFEPEPEPTKPLSRLRVFLEAGHGWSGNSFDPGAVGHVEEYEQNLEQMGVCAKRLRELGATVHAEGYGKGTPARSLRQRGEISKPTDLFVSFHNNAFDGTVQGTETLFDRLGDADDEAFAKVVQKELAPATGFTDRGVKRQGLGVLRGAKTASFAACLTESFFVDGPKLPQNTVELNRRIGFAVAEAIQKYAHKTPELVRRMKSR